MAFISVHKIANRLKVTPQSVYLWIKTGRIKKEDVKIMQVDRIFIREDIDIKVDRQVQKRRKLAV